VGGGMNIVPVPTVQHIDKQIIVTELSGLPDKLGEDLKKLLNEHLHLREAMHEKDEQTRESKKRLDLLENKENQAVREVRIIEEKNDSVRKELSTKRVALTELQAQKSKEETAYADALSKLQSAKSKVDAINHRKKNLETKIHDLVEDSGELYINLAPYLQDVISKREGEVSKSREILGKFDASLSSLRTDVKILEDELTDMTRKTDGKRLELEDVRNRKAKVESELNLVSSARDETESKLRAIVEKKKLMEEKLKELMERSE
jgi:DNA repair exonuclease SbcCD ATPase subunit